jgi:hypothetical protein
MEVTGIKFIREHSQDLYLQTRKSGNRIIQRKNLECNEVLTKASDDSMGAAETEAL